MPAQVVVVDNGSRDDVEAAVREVPGVRLVREPRIGSYAARNRGLAVTAAPVVAFTDADCLPERDWLERGVALLAGADVVAGRIDVFPRSAHRQGAIEAYERLTAFPQRHFVERWGFGATANVLTRRSVIDAVGPFDPDLESGGDAEWGQRVTAAGYRVVYGPDAVVRHPARRTLRELSAKFRRITRGIHQLHTARGELPPLPAALADSVTGPWRRIPQVLRDERLPRHRDRLRFFAVELVVAVLVTSETARCRRAGRGPGR